MLEPAFGLSLCGSKTHPLIVQLAPARGPLKRHMGHVTQHLEGSICCPNSARLVALPFSKDVS